MVWLNLRQLEMVARILPHPVDRVEVLSVIDNVLDLLLTSTDVAKRIGPGGRERQRTAVVEAPLLESGQAEDAPVAEHGLSFLVSVTSGENRRAVLFDTGSSVGGLVHNLRALGVEPAEIEAIVLSHGHFDHTIGLNGLAEQFRPLPPLVVHPDVWLRRRVAIPGREPLELLTTSREKIRAAGFRVIEEREPSSLLDGNLLLGCRPAVPSARAAQSLPGRQLPPELRTYSSRSHLARRAELLCPRTSTNGSSSCSRGTGHFNGPGTGRPHR